MLQSWQAQEFSGACENYILEGKKVRFLVSQYTKYLPDYGPAKVSGLPKLRLSRQARSVGRLPARRGARLRAFGFARFPGPWPPALVAAAQSTKIGWPRNNQAAGHIRVTLPRGARRHRLLCVPGAGSEWMSSKQPRSSPALQTEMKRLSCSAGVESTICGDLAPAAVGKVTLSTMLSETIDFCCF